MAKRVMEPMHDEHVNVTPLIDVVMCLIIFFLLVGKLAKDETAAKLHLPGATRGLELTDQQGRLILNVVPKPGLKQANAPGDAYVITRNPDPLEMTSLTPFLRQEKARNKELKLVVRAERSLPYSCIAPVLISCAQADIRSVNFSTENKQ